MKAKSRWFWLLLSLPLIAGLVGAGWFFYAMRSGPPAGLFAQAGYLTLRLVTDYHAPGSIYKVENQSDHQVNLHPTCEIDRVDVANAIQVQRTTNVSEEIERKLSAGYKVAPEHWKKLKLSIDLQGVQDIKAVYANSKVELLSTEKIQILLNSYLNRDGCFAAVKSELEGGFKVCQTEAVIVSDLVYEVTYRAQGSHGFNGTLEGVVGVAGESRIESGRVQRISGDKMYHAVRLHRPTAGDSCIILNTATADRGPAAGAATNMAARHPG